MGMTVTILAETKDEYTKALLIFDERQTRMTNTGIKESACPSGYVLDPAEFPEAVRFIIQIKRD